MRSGVAQVSTSALTVGTHTITADYSGDANFLISTGTLSGGQVVKAPAVAFNQRCIDYGRRCGHEGAELYGDLVSGEQSDGDDELRDCGQHGDGAV